MELIIVMAIMGIMAGAGFVSLQSSKSDSRLKSAQREVSAAIKLAQSYALQGKTHSLGGVDTTPCGYGFRFDSTDAQKQTYEIFYNLLDKTQYASCDIQNGNAANLHFISWGNPPSGHAGTFTLNNNVDLQSPAISPAPNQTEIYFTIPFRNMYKEDGGKMVSDKTFTFEYPAGSATAATKAITISPSGNITEN